MYVLAASQLKCPLCLIRPLITIVMDIDINKTRINEP